MTARELYEIDFFEWTQRNAQLLDRGCLEQADIPHIAEEIADIGRRDRREVESYLSRLVNAHAEMAVSGGSTQRKLAEQYRRL